MNSVRIALKFAYNGLNYHGFARQPNVKTIEEKILHYLEKIEYIKEIKGTLVLKFVNINAIDDALKLVGYSIYVSKGSTNTIKSDGIVGFTVKDMDDNIWGKVKRVEIYRLNKFLEIQNNDDVYYVPFYGEIVKEINKKEKLIRIDPPKGLKDLNKK